MTTIDIMLPVYNEAATLNDSVARLYGYLRNLPEPMRESSIVIVDNASTDDTPAIGQGIAARYPGVRYQRLTRKGRGHALKTAWSDSDADIVAYMDIDLATDLSHIPELLLPIITGQADTTYGTRLANGSVVTGRSNKREVLSRGYNHLLHWFMDAEFSDAQCGFKAINRISLLDVLPNIKDNTWFFDTELLLQLQYRGYRLQAVPVVWTDDPTSSVHIATTVWGDIRGMARVYRAEKPYSPMHRLTSFGIIGVLSTIGYGLLYAVLTQALPDQAANLLTLVILTLANIALNRRFTYRQRGTANLRRHYLAALAAFGIAWGLSGGGLWLAQQIHPGMGQMGTALVVTSLSMVATITKYLLFGIAFRGPTGLTITHANPVRTASSRTKEFT